MKPYCRERKVQKSVTMGASRAGESGLVLGGDRRVRRINKISAKKARRIRVMEMKTKRKKKRKGPQ